MGCRKEIQCRLLALIFAALSVAQVATNSYSMASTLTSLICSGLLLVSSIILGVLFWDISRCKPADSHSMRTVILQYILMTVLVNVGKRVRNKLLKSSSDVHNLQEKVLAAILSCNRGTQYALEHGLQTGVDSRQEYVSKQPLTQYRNYLDYVAAIERGEQNVLTKDPVVFMALTSGTTGFNKHIPITGNMKGPSARKVGSLMYASMDQKAGLNLQRVLVLSYQSRVTETAAGLRVGPVSAHMSRYVPFMVAPREVYDITNEQAALHTHAVFGFLEREVGHIEALMSTLVYSFWRYVEDNWQVICDDIEHGRLSTDLPAPNKQLEAISRLFKPQPERANELREMFANGFESISLRIWPELRFVRTLTTGGFALHAQLLSNYYMKGVKLLSLAHVASEGFIGFNISENPDEQIYTAMPDYAFLEFIPLSDTGLDQPKTQFLEELKRGGEYEVVMTTPMGLHRYRTGDIIKVVGFQNQAPIYEFQYRLGQILNIYWEKTDEAAMFESVSRALERLPRKEKTRLVDYTTTEDICIPHLAAKKGEQTKKHYYLFIEVEGAKGEEILMTDQEKSTFDGTLCEVSEAYSLIRQSGSAAPMVVVQVKPGTFIQMKSTLILWTQNQQYKCPRVMRRPEFLNLLLNSSCE